ncbi:hypothetical protein M413DRAFT_445671 [Hebeloma cylindrosporum]|uniref:tRNA (adenine(58)-N(1))-methyltransferase catalytic subunit TRM61 n=1 Tax=Hebeloma cylindrosporum TaxID=76867 RepID=A0A0C3BWA5_HEBCY|nr:hypothetical protein M413DRAFT_445671 [Hebeloma cylindrosporum h7]
MWSIAREVAAGDTVIIWLTRDQVQPLVVTPGKDFNTKFGNFRQADFVGVLYGSKVPSKTGRGFIHILRPTPELWTIALPHRTQILYLADIAFITSYLNIRHGSRVIEAGTGSASFSHSVARTIGSSGHLYSYEFHEARYLKAKEEFTRHKMDDVVTIQHRNVCKDGFTIVDEADAVFLDLPAPWDAVEHAKRALRKDRVTRICCFSPCMEQVLRTVSALNEAGFTEITMYETLLRPIEVFQIPPLPNISLVSEKIKISEQKREEKRLRQIAANKAAAAAASGAPGGSSSASTNNNVNAKRKREDAAEDLDDDEENADEISAVVEGLIASKKKMRTDIGEEDEEAIVEQQEEMDEDGSPLLSGGQTDIDAVKNEGSDPSPQLATTSSHRAPKNASGLTHPAAKINVAKALPEVRGHTSYLTFACLIPIPASAASLASQEDSKKNAVVENP